MTKKPTKKEQQKAELMSKLIKYATDSYQVIERGRARHDELNMPSDDEVVEDNTTAEAVMDALGILALPLIDDIEKLYGKRTNKRGQKKSSNPS